ncbi:MAG: UDP-3-O-(3-hydroxymyristoyl)glucosamine N-acyltransferase [Synergistes sp.]|nr:UDP-3-O-(3-hydroxymyristoyl)glucosamine N-acyltransferase [Synergistes sp.]
MSKSITLGEIAAMTGGEVKGDPAIVITAVAPPHKAVEGSISPLWEKKFLSDVKEGTVLFTGRGKVAEGQNGVEVDDPRVALIALLRYFDEAPVPDAAISEKAIISPTARLAANVTVAAGAVIRDSATIGEGTVILENAVIGENCEIGKECLIEPGAVIYHGTKIGNKCVLHANCVIGCDGFGFVPDPKGGMMKIPQIGITHLADGVEIGAFTSVDRATFGETYIGPCTKIDSHVKVGHNCEIGAYTILVSQCGIAGSSKIGNGVIMAARSGVANHATVGDRCTIGGNCGVFADVPPGSTYSGFPAQDHKKELRQMAIIKKLPEYIEEIKELRKKIERLEK